MQIHDFIAVKFPNDLKTYYAEVKKFFRDGSFECRFVHSGSIYTFKPNRQFLEVLKSSGSFKPGTIVGDATIYIPLEDGEKVSGANVVVTFDDGNSYLGIVEKIDPVNINFLHSGNTYSIDQNQIAHRPGGTYDGRKALSIEVYGKGKNLFLGDHDLFLSLRIKDEFGNPLRGEFEARIHQSTTNKEVYINPALIAENSMAEDKLTIKGKANQQLTLFVAFHPALLPFNFNPIESSMIDRDTMISTTFPFEFGSNTKALHFEIIMNYDHVSVNASTKQEAVKTVFNQVTTNKSHSFAIKLEGESAISLFGVGGKISGGGTTTDVNGAGTIGGETNADISGESISTEWKVNFPKGLQVNFTKN